MEKEVINPSSTKKKQQLHISSKQCKIKIFQSKKISLLVGVLMLYEGQRNKLDKLVPFSAKWKWYIFVCACISSGPDLISHQFEILYYSRKIISSPNGFQIHVLLKLDCLELDHRTVLEQRFDGQNMCSSMALRSQDLKPEFSTCHSSLPHQNFLGKAHYPRENSEQALGNRQWLALPGSPWCHSSLFLFSIAPALSLPSPGHPHHSPRCAVTHCTSTSTKVLKVWVFKARKRNVNEHGSFLVLN